MTTPMRASRRPCTRRAVSRYQPAMKAASTATPMRMPAIDEAFPPRPWRQFTGGQGQRFEIDGRNRGEAPAEVGTQAHGGLGEIGFGIGCEIGRGIGPAHCRDAMSHDCDALLRGKGSTGEQAQGRRNKAAAHHITPALPRMSLRSLSVARR